MQQAVRGYAAGLDSDHVRQARAVQRVSTDATPCTPADAADFAQRIIGCYRARDWVDPKVFTLSLVQLMCDYPVVVVALAADPVGGIPRLCKFAPSIAEVADELDRIKHRLSLADYAARRVLGEPFQEPARTCAPSDDRVAALVRDVTNSLKVAHEQAQRNPSSAGRNADAALS